MAQDKITVFLADDNLIVREGVRALLGLESDIEVVGVAADHDELVAGATATAPNVVVTDIRMPPSFQTEGIEAAKEIRRRHPGTGVVILSQYDDPEYAIELLREGSDGYGYLLKDRIAEGDQLARAVRAVAIGASVLDPTIVEAIVRPVSEGDLSQAEEELLRMIAEGRPYKSIAATLGTPPAAVAHDVEKLFLKIAQGASAGAVGALKRLQILHQAIVDREEVGERLGNFLPAGLAAKLRADGRQIGESEVLNVTVLMSDVRGYSGISERVAPSALARQLSEHRALLNGCIGEEGGTVMTYTGDGVFAVFGAPLPCVDHPDRALAASLRMHREQQTLNERWEKEGLEGFRLGVGLSTGEVAAALLGSAERMEYTLVGDTVNLSSRLQDLARPGGQVVMSEATYSALTGPVDAVNLGPTMVKGRTAPVTAYRIEALETGA